MQKIFIAVITSILFIGCNKSDNQERTQQKQIPTSQVPTVSEDQLNIAEMYLEAANGALTVEGQLTHYNLISSISRMAGSYLFRTFNNEEMQANPGDIMLSVEANSKGPKLVQTLGLTLQQLNIQISRATDADLSDSLSLEFLDSQRILESSFKDLNVKNNFSNEQMADILCIAAALTIEENKDQLDPTAAFGLAVMGFIEGTKTMPAEID